MPFWNVVKFYSRRTTVYVMKKSAIPLLLALTALMVRPHTVLAQATPAPIRGSWERLKVIPPGDELTVKLRSGQTIKGRLNVMSDTSLTLAQGRNMTDVCRGDVLQVHRRISKSAKRATLMGLGIGAGVGLTGSVAAAKSGPGEGDADLWALVAGVIGAGVGALAGYIIGSRKHRELIYETN
jgi:hypothetical protein